MHGWTGFATLFAGLGLAAYTFHPGAGGLDAAALFARAPQAPAMPAEPASEALSNASGRTRLFSPQSPLFAPAQSAVAVAPARGAPPASMAKIADGQPVVTAALQPWTSTVHVTDVPTAAVKSRSSRPGNADARAELTRDLQRELKRVGCYDGEIDGSWGGASKRAMTAFNERVNATLPVDEPDYILLTLLQGHRDQACGAACPNGQAMADGRCQSKPQVAQVQRRPNVAPVAAAGLVAAGAVVVVEQERRTVQKRAGQVAAESIAKAPDMHAVRPASPVAPVSPVNGSASHAAAPVVASPRPALAVAAAAPVVVSIPVDPLPGRMTIGGPLPPSETKHAPVYAAPEQAAPAVHAQPHRAAPQRAARAPAHVAPPPRAPRPQQYASSGGGSSASSRQRSMIYNLFQRPDRY